MYEILKQYEKIGRREMTVTELRELLGIAPTEYADRTGWSNFKNYVLDSCQEALKQMTDICYTYERGKTGRGGKWLTIVFHIQKNKDYVDQLTLSEYMKQPEPEPIETTVSEEADVRSAARSAFDKEGEFVGQTTLFDKDDLEKKRLKNYKPPEEEDYTGGESSFNIDKWYQPAESYDPESIEFK